MSSLRFLRFAKFHLVFREIYKPALRINGRPLQARLAAGLDCPRRDTGQAVIPENPLPARNFQYDAAGGFGSCRNLPAGVCAHYLLEFSPILYMLR
jgi:hypothetical protein